MDTVKGQALIVLTREKRGWRDRARSYVVMLDGEQVAKVKRGERLEFPVTAGRHEIHLQISWCKSPSVQVVATPGEVIDLFCAPGGSANAALGDVLGGSKEYIHLARV